MCLWVIAGSRFSKLEVQVSVVRLTRAWRVGSPVRHMPSFMQSTRLDSYQGTVTNCYKIVPKFGSELTDNHIHSTRIFSK